MVRLRYGENYARVVSQVQAGGAAGARGAGLRVGPAHRAPGGEFPLNTNGGGLSYAHPGMYGIFTVIEAARRWLTTIHGRVIHVEG